jgi:hypothetical protein
MDLLTAMIQSMLAPTQYAQPQQQMGQPAQQGQPQQSQMFNPFNMGFSTTKTKSDPLSTNPMIAQLQMNKAKEEAEKKSGTRIAGIKI